MGDIMAKLKKATLSMNNKEKSFAYEIIGIISLLISLISIAKFGLIGKYLVLTFSLLFGDWYFVFIALVGLFGVYCLIFHKKVELKSIRYYGIILILLSLLIISHFGMHDYVSQFEGNALKVTLRLYFDYFKSSSTSMIKGGGLVGSLCFYFSYFLLGKIGTILISLILIFVGIVFLSKKTIREFIEMIIRVCKKIIKFMKKRFDNVIDNVKEICKDYETKHQEKIKAKVSSKKIKKKEDNVSQINNCERNVDILKQSFEHLNIDLISITYLICEHIVVYFIKTKQEVNYKVLEFSLKGKLDENFLVKYDKFNDQLLLELNRFDGKYLSLRKAKKEVSKDNLTFVLGIDDRNLLVELDDNLIIVGKNKELVNLYVLSIMTFYVKQKKYIPFSLGLIDLTNGFSEYEFNNIEYIDNIDYLDEVVQTIDINLELLNLHHKKDIEEYNLYYKEKINKKKYIIYGIEHIVYKSGAFDKLLYIIQTGKLAGVSVVLVTRENIMLSSIVLSSVDKKLLLENDFDFSNKIIDNSYFDILNNNIEAFYKDKDLIIRISLLLMSNEEKDEYYNKKTS